MIVVRPEITPTANDLQIITTAHNDTPTQISSAQALSTLAPSAAAPAGAPDPKIIHVGQPAASAQSGPHFIFND